jgi:hypothetical protein
MATDDARGAWARRGADYGAVEGRLMRSWVQAMWGPLLAVVALFALGSALQIGAALLAATSVEAAPPVQQVGGLPLCTSPRRAEEVPERASEMRLARDAAGVLWQIQSGCRHQVTPYFMDTATLNAIPQGEDAAFISYGFPSLVPTPSPLNLPAYARLPADLLRVPAQAAAPVPPAPAPAPGTLDRYVSRVLVVDPAAPTVVYVLQGGLRHRVLIYYPLDVALADVDPSRAGDLGSYALRGPEGYVPTIDAFPWGEPAPLQGWATGESAIVSDRVISPDAVNCADVLTTPTPLAQTFGNLTPLPTRVVPRRAQVACDRLREAQEVQAAAYISNPGQYAGRDLRLVNGVACEVRYNAARDGKTFAYTVGDSSVAGFAPGAEVQRDGRFASFQRITLGTFVSTVTETSGASTSGELIVFAYLHTGGGPCPAQGR